MAGTGTESVLRNRRLYVPFAAVIITMLGIASWPLSTFAPLPNGCRLAEQEQCSLAVRLGPQGLWEGQWRKASLDLGKTQPNDDVPGGTPTTSTDIAKQEDADESKIGRPDTASRLSDGGASRSLDRRSLRTSVWNDALESEGLFGRSKRLVVGGGDNGEEVGEGEGREGVTAGLDDANFNLSDPITLAFARLVNEYMEYWVKIEGVKEGLGRKGVVKARMFPAMARNNELIPCTVHIRIVNGTVYFRYGAFLGDRRKLLRANHGVKMIQDAVEEYNLKDLQAELFLNVCDEPLGFDNSMSPGRSGFPVFSTHVTGGTTDIAVPDPMDLTFSLADLRPARGTAWDKLADKAVFRGASTNFDLKAMNYAASPRFRLHQMTSVRPDLLDAKVTEWGKKDQPLTKGRLVRDGFRPAKPLSPEKLSGFKYFLVVDDAVGTTGMCEALARRQVAIRQSSPFIQFFDPMLLPGVHHIQVEHSFRDLFPVIEWMKTHDCPMQSIISMANDIAPQICSWKARTLYWAIALSKYVNLALEDPTVLVAPPNVCNGSAIEEPAGIGETCKVANMVCGNFCTEKAPPEHWTWLSAPHALKHLKRLDPLGKKMAIVS